MPSTMTDRLNGTSSSLAVKAPCRVATTSNIALSGLQAIDGITVAEGDRVLVKDQTSAADNGIYRAGSSAWTRAPDFDGSLDAMGGTQVYVIGGTENSNSTWKVSGFSSGIVIGADAIVFATAGISEFGELLEEAVAAAELIAVTLDEAQLAIPSTNVGQGGGAYGFMLDSLSFGAGTAPEGGTSSLRKHFQRMARGAHGDGGPGWRPMSNDSAVFYGDSFSKSAGLTYIAVGDGVYGQYSLDGGGVYELAGGGTSALTYIPTSAWTTANLYYLKGPTMGTFQYRKHNQATSYRVDVDCDDASVGLGVEVITLAADAASTGIIIETITGNVAIFGFDFQLNETGYRPFNISLGGRTLQAVAAQDSAMRQEWYAAIDLKALFLNGGMNDRVTRTGAQHYADWEIIVDDIQTASPGTSLVMVQSLESSDYSTTNLDDYTAQKVLLAAEKEIAYLDLRNTFGNYAEALAAGFMLDAVHHNDRANRIIAALYGQAVGIPFGLRDPGATAWGGAGAGGAVYRGSLTPIEESVTAAATRKVLWTIGLTNGNPAIWFTADIVVNRNGTGGSQRLTADFPLINGATLDQAALAKAGDTPAVTLVKETTAGDANTNDVTIDVTIASNLAEIAITTELVSNVTATCDYKAMLLSTAGVPVFEH